MAGHSKWANTKHRKAAQDAKRGKIFTKIIRELVASTKLGGGDPAANPRLRTAIDKALLNNMARDTINKAILRGMGSEDGSAMETMIYEGYGPGGTAIMVECLSDNRNRTVSEVRHAFSKVGSHLASEGSVSYLFSKHGILSYPAGDNNDELIETAINMGAEDIVSNDKDSIDVLTSPDSFSFVKNGLDSKGFIAVAAEVSFVAMTKVALDNESALKLLRLIELLEDCDDVQEIYHNGEFPK